MPQGSKGVITVWNDFSGAMGDVTWGTGQVDLGGGLGFVSDNEGTVNEIANESGGVVQFLTDTGNDDNICLLAGPFDPSQGPVTIECRFKISDSITLGAVFCGFSETMALDTPVMPAEFATSTMTYNGTGGMLGLLWDPDASTNAWKALSGDGGAVGNATNYGADGTDATDAMVLDEFDIVKVVLTGDRGEVWHDEELVASGVTGTTGTDLVYAVLMCENRSAAAEQFEVDYFWAEGPRDWTV